MSDTELKDAWKALDHLVGKLPLYEFHALRKCVEETQEAADAAKRIWPKVAAATIDKTEQPPAELPTELCPRCHPVLWEKCCGQGCQQPPTESWRLCLIRQRTSPRV